MNKLERILDRLYRLCGALAAGFIVIIAILIISEVVLRFFGWGIPGVIELATFSLLAATFLAVAQTLRRNEHIRITLLIGILPARIRRLFELWALVVSLIVFSILGWYTLFMTIDSFVYGEKSDGVIGFPFWIPQTIMFLGVAMLILTLVEEIIKILSGRWPVYISDAPEDPELEGAFEAEETVVQPSETPRG